MIQNIKNSLDTVVGSTLIKLWAYAQLDEVIQRFETRWVYNDGSAMPGRSDMIALAKSAKDAIRRGDSNWATWDDVNYYSEIIASSSRPTIAIVPEYILYVVCTYFG